MLGTSFLLLIILIIITTVIILDIIELLSIYWCINIIIIYCLKMSSVVIVMILNHYALAGLIVWKHWRWTWRTKYSIICKEIVEVWNIFGCWRISAWVLIHDIVHHRFNVLLRNVIILVDFFFLLRLLIFIQEVEREQWAVVLLFRLLLLLILNVNCLILIREYLWLIHELFYLALR